MEVKKNECVIQYNVGEKVLKFDEQIIQLFKNRGFRFTGSGYGCGIRDLCFKREENCYCTKKK